MHSSPRALHHRLGRRLHIGIVVVLVVVALVVPILLLARAIGNEAAQDQRRARPRRWRTPPPLEALRTTIEPADAIIGGLRRGRNRLGG